MNYAVIKPRDIANGLGVRVSLFVSGCTHRCKGCFNSEAWDFSYGALFDREVEDNILELLAPSYIRGLSLLGGEPFECANQTALEPFLKRVKSKYPDKDIWCYSGYTFENDILKGRAHCDVTDSILSMIDILVDGKFIEEKKNIRLKFRGSENQRIIDMKKTLKSGKVVIAME